MDLQTFVDSINSLVWSPALIVVCLGGGVLFSVWSRFLQVRHFKSMVTLLLKGQASESGVSSFQGFAMALGGRVGTGNIAGVATAIAMGGPGAMFWMWAIAFLGAGSAFAESALAQVWKEKLGGEYRGGPAYYIEHGLGWRAYAKLFAVVAALSCGVLLPGVQSNSITSAWQHAAPTPSWVIGSFICALLGVIVFGGVKRIGKVAELIVPFMALGYILTALLIVALKIEEVPAMLALIFRSAFGLDATFGGIVGLAIAWGVKRGIYSNEAGQGTGPQAAAAAEVAHPAQQGLVQAFSVYVDTLLVCSATGLMILITGTYNVKGSGDQWLHQGVPGVSDGPAFTQLAVDQLVPGLGAGFVAVALFFFAFTTLLAYAYYAECNIAYLLRNANARWGILAVRLLLLVATFFGAVREAKLMWALGDIGVGLMAWLNMIAIFALGKVSIAVLKDYEAQERSGGEMRFLPRALGLRNTSCWKE